MGNKGRVVVENTIKVVDIANSESRVPSIEIAYHNGSSQKRAGCMYVYGENGCGDLTNVLQCLLFICM